MKLKQELRQVFRNVNKSKQEDFDGKSFSGKYLIVDTSYY